MNEPLLHLNSEVQTSKFLLQMPSMDYTHITAYLEVSMIQSNLLFSPLDIHCKYISASENIPRNV